MRAPVISVQSESEFCGTIGPIGPRGSTVKRKRFFVEQITSVLRKPLTGISVGDIYRQVGSRSRRSTGGRTCVKLVLPSSVTRSRYPSLLTSAVMTGSPPSAIPNC